MRYEESPYFHSVCQGINNYTNEDIGKTIPMCYLLLEKMKKGS